MPPKTDRSEWRVLTMHGLLKKGMARQSSILAWRTPGTAWKCKKMTLEDEPLSSEGIQYVNGQEQRAITNSSRKNEVAGPKQKWLCYGCIWWESKFWCSEEQYYIETWNVRSMNQSKLDMVKQEMAKVNINIWGISELKWMGMGEFNSDDHYLLLWARIP